MFYQLPHVPVLPISYIDPLPDLFPKESPTSISEHPRLVSEFPPSIFYVPSHASDEPPTSIIDVPTDTVPVVDPAGPSDSHAFRRSHRVTTLPSHLRDFHCFSALASLWEPQNFREASSNPLWKQAMKEELDALHKIGTWDLVNLPSGKSAIGCKWVYKITTRSDDIVDCYKAHLIARGFTQEYGIDYEETFALVARFSSAGLLLPFLRLVNGRSFRWMSKMIFLMVNS